MSKPTKLTEKNITHERRSPRLMTLAEKRPPAEKNPKKSAPKKKRKVPEAGLERKQEENEIKESKKAREECEC